MSKSPPENEGPSTPKPARPRAQKQPKKSEPADAGTALPELLAGAQFQGEVRSRESRAESFSRLEAEKSKAAHEQTLERAREAHDRKKDLILFVFVLVVVTMVAVLCFALALRSGESEDKKWAMSVLAAIASSGLGYLVGKSGKTG